MRVKPPGEERSTDFAADLNAEQRSAVEQIDGPLLVIAGPGTGKTRVVTHRVAHLVASGSAHGILAVTFTNKAAEEMRARVSALLSGVDPGSRPDATPWIGTIHSFCAELCGDHALDFGLDPHFRIADDAGRVALLTEVIARTPLEYIEFRGRPENLAADIVGFIDRAKNDGVTPASLGDYLKAPPEDESRPDPALRDVLRLWEGYEALCGERGLADYGDLILWALEGLRRRPGVLSALQERFSHVVCDEYQDTDAAQSDLLDLLAAGTRNLCVVGDDDQSIYRFRGASSINLRSFRERYPEARVVDLRASYRSVPAILRASAALVAHNPDSLPKKLHPVSGDAPEAVIPRGFPDEAAQAAFVADEIGRLRAEGSLGPDDTVGVLMRSVRGRTEPVARALRDAGIDHVVVGGAPLFGQPEIKDLMAWITALVEPGDSPSLVRAAWVAPSGLSGLEVRRVMAEGRRAGLGSFFDALTHVVEHQEGELAECARAFLDLHRRLADFARERDVRELVRELVRLLGIPERGADDAWRRIARFEQLADAAASVAPDGELDLAAFRDYLICARLRDDVPDDEPSPAPVTLMTVHKAKGLEFDVVFVVDAVQTKMPGSRRSERLAVPSALAAGAPTDADSREAHVAEERRIFYVAMTRARRKLYLLWPERYAQNLRSSAPSQFLGEALGEGWCEALPPIGPPAALAHAEPVAGGHTFSQAFRALAGRIRAGASRDEMIAALEAAEGARSGPVPAEAAASPGEASLPDPVPRTPQGEADVSLSAIERYRRCPRQFHFAEVYRIPEPESAEQRIGTAVHRALEVFHKADAHSDPAPEVLRRLEAELRRRFGSGPRFEEIWRRVAPPLEHYCRTARERGAMPLHVERSFAFNVGGHRVRGRVDLVEQGPDGALRLVDFKTGSARRSSQLKDDVQLRAYWMGAVEDWRLEPARAAYHYILEGGGATSVPCDAEALEAARGVMTEALDGIAARRFDPVPSYRACRSCGFQALCDAAVTSEA